MHVFLDDDASGRSAFKAAAEEGLIETSGVNFTKVGGKSEAELEDLYADAVYESIVLSETGLNWTSRGPDRSKKWADRLRNLLRRAGKPNDDGTVQIIKLKVAQQAAQLNIAALHPSKRGPVDSLRTALVAKLGDHG